jgi:hypothetical protein
MSGLTLLFNYKRKHIMKQTAVEFLMEKLFDPSTMVQEQIQWFEQAKKMEKEQIMDAYISGEHQQGFEGEAEAYYNETFNSEEKDELQDDWDVTLNDGIED